jgi:Rha family phage regulatory protein
MNKQLVFIDNNRVVTDSLTVAECFGKRHDLVLRDIENQISKLKEAGEGEWGVLNFAETQYQHPQNKQWYKKYLLTEEAFTLVAFSYVTPEAMKMKVRFIEEFKRMKEELQKRQQPLQPKTQAEMLLLYAQQMVEMERQNAIRDQKISALENGVRVLTTNLTAVPEHTKVIELVNEYARWTRMGHNEVYNTVYKIMQAQYGIDVRTRVENERRRINEEYYRKTGKYYAESTLKKKVNGIDIMVRMGCLDKFHKILVGLLAKAKVVAQ